MTARFQIKRGTTAQWAATTYILHDGQLGVDKDTGEIKLGDGFSPWAELPIILSSQYVLSVGGKAPDSDKLDGNDSSFYMPASRATDFMSATAGPFLPLHGKADDADKLDGNDSTYFALASDVAQASATRKLSTNWGNVTAFPTTGVQIGDTCVRTDQGINGSLWTYSGTGRGVSGWTHRGPLVTTSAWRPSAVYAGLEMFETNTRRLYVYDPTAASSYGPWVYVTGGTAPYYVITPLSGWYGWNDTRGGGYENLYWTYEAGHIHLRGLFGNANAYGPGTSAICTLPSDISPAYICLRSVFCTPGITRVDVHPANDASYPNQLTIIPGSQHPANTYYSIDISWPITNNRPLVLP